MRMHAHKYVCKIDKQTPLNKPSETLTPNLEIGMVTNVTFWPLQKQAVHA